METKTQYKHSYFVFRKLKENNIFMNEWNSEDDNDSLNEVVKKIYTQNLSKAKKLQIEENILLVELIISEYKLVFIECLESDYNFPHLFILLNFFKLDEWYPRNGTVAIKGTQTFFRERSVIDYYELPSTILEVNGLLYEEEGVKESIEIESKKYIINTHEPFCKFCEEFNNGLFTFEANTEMWKDFSKYLDRSWANHEKSKGIYKYIELKDLYILFDFEKVIAKQEGINIR